MKFKIGSKVYHVTAESYGRIEDAWFDGHETRYAIRHTRRQLWSVPQSHVVRHKRELNPSKSVVNLALVKS